MEAPMTDSTVAHTDMSSADKAGTELGSRINEALNGPPDALILFGSPKYEYEPLLRAVDATCRPKVLVGCSSAGEFTSDAPRHSSACAIAVRSDEMRFSAGLGRNLRADRTAAAKSLVSSFAGLTSDGYSFRSAMVLTDALAGYADDLIEQITVLTAGSYQLFGGGAGDDAAFQRTHVFFGTEAVPDAAVVLEILSNKPVGIGVSHGWLPASSPMRVTESDGARLVSLNAAPAVEAFEQHAEGTCQRFDPNEPLPFFLHNVLGIQSPAGYKLRVPLKVNPDGSVSCAADIPTGSTVAIMRATVPSAAAAATEAANAAMRQLGNHKPGVAIFFDCVATRLRTGKEFGLELGALAGALGGAAFAGCNTYGQVARAEGQFGGFHNCTAVIGILPG